MSTLIMLCPRCTKPSQLDSDSLAGGPTSFPCPHCEEALVIDKRELLDMEPPIEPSSAGPSTALGNDSSEPTGSTTQGRTPIDTLAEVAAQSSSDPRFIKLPSRVHFPSGIVLGEDEGVILDLQQRMAALGSELQRVESANAARELIVSQQPTLCVYVGGDVTAPPYKPMAPLMGLPPSLRRHLYLVLVASNLRTLDGMSAFMHQVNMTLAQQDIPHFAAALYTGFEFHERLYKPYFHAAEGMRV